MVGTAGGGVGGSDSPILNDKIPLHTHTMNSTGAHQHSYDAFLESGGNGFQTATGVVRQTVNTTSNGNHVHTIADNAGGADWTPKYVDMIICEKD